MFRISGGQFDLNRSPGCEPMPEAGVRRDGGQDPSEMEGRATMATATWIKDLLQERGVAFAEEQHREVFTAQEVAQSEHVSGHRLAKVVAVIAYGRPVELVVPASRRVILEEVERMLGAREVRLASEAEMDRIFGGIETGAIPALRHWKDV